MFQKHYQSPLEIAIFHDNIAAVKLILENGGHSYLNQKSGKRRKVIPSSNTTSLFNSVSGRTRKPEEFYQLLMEYFDIKSSLDEVLYYFSGACENCLPITKELVNMGASPIIIFTVSEIGDTSNSVNKTWPSEKSSNYVKDTNAYFLDLLSKKYGLSKKEIYDKYVKTMTW